MIKVIISQEVEWNKAFAFGLKKMSFSRYFLNTCDYTTDLIQPNRYLYFSSHWSLKETMYYTVLFFQQIKAMRTQGFLLITDDGHDLKHSSMVHYP